MTLFHKPIDLVFNSSIITFYSCNDCNHTIVINFYDSSKVELSYEYQKLNVPLTLIGSFNITSSASDFSHLSGKSFDI